MKKTKQKGDAGMNDPTCKGKWTPALRNYVVLTNRKMVGEAGGIRLPNFLCFYSGLAEKKGGV